MFSSSCELKLYIRACLMISSSASMNFATYWRVPLNVSKHIELAQGVNRLDATWEVQRKGIVGLTKPVSFGTPPLCLLLGPPEVPFYPFLGEGFPTQIHCRKNGYPYSNLSTGGPG